MSTSYLLGTVLASPSSSVANYAPAVGQFGSWGSSLDGAREMVAPMAFDVSGFKARVGTAPGLGKSWTVDLLKNGSAVSTSTISDTATAGTTGSTVSFATGDVIAVKITPSGTPTAPGARVSWTANMDGSTAGQSPIMFCSTGQPENWRANYHSPMGGTTTAWSWDETNYPMMIPTGGTISNLRVRLSTNPGTGKSYTFTLEKRTGSGAASSQLSTVLSDAETTDTSTGSFSVAADDSISLKCLPSGTPTAVYAQVSYIFTATTTGESVLMGGLVSGTNNGTDYNVPIGSGKASVWASGETGNTQLYMPACTATKIIVRTAAAPGSGKSFVWTLRKNAADTALVATQANPAVTASDTDAGVAFAEGDYLSVKHDSASVAGYPLQTRIGIVFYAAAPPVEGAATPAGTSTVTADGQVAKEGAATPAGAATVSSPPALEVVAATTVTGVAALTAAGDVLGSIIGSATISGATTTTASGVVEHGPTVTPAGTSTTATAAEVALVAATTSTGTSTISASGIRTSQASAALTGTSTLTAPPSLAIHAATTTAGAASIIAHAGITGVRVEVATRRPDHTPSATRPQRILTGRRRSTPRQ